MLSNFLKAEVLNTLVKVSHNLFTTTEYKKPSYSDSALHLRHNQTISQPYIVALMTQITGPEEMVLPFAEPSLAQNLIVLTKKKNGALDEKFIAGARFVPMKCEVSKWI